MLVLDANILVRAVLGRRVRELLARYGRRVEFFVPDVMLEEAREILPGILDGRSIPVAPAIEYLDSLSGVVHPVQPVTYASFESIARQRLARRDEEDWPVLAAALALRCPIWTEDRDFFGCGVATWTTDRVEFYLRDATS